MGLQIVNPKGVLSVNELRLGTVEMKFAEAVWNSAPLPSGELVKLCKAELGWSKSTTYTVLRRLCERGLFKNDNGVVETLIDKNEYFAKKSATVVENDFGGSLPAFISAFTSGKKLTEKEIDEIQDMIDAFRRGDENA
ncbi:MAG: BlaI/MecI/CopY family transcriptional regulator [Clostridia bacterium]|nr:BlaI/MecI/CopY family transcriptional regulator [Clostridia bacterium]